MPTDNSEFRRQVELNELSRRAAHVGTLTNAESAFERIAANLPVLLNGGVLVAYSSEFIKTKPGAGASDFRAITILFSGILLSVFCVACASFAQHLFKKAASHYYQNAYRAQTGNQHAADIERLQHDETGSWGSCFRILAIVTWAYAIGLFSVGVLLLALQRTT